MGSEWQTYALTDLYSVSSGLSKPAKDFGEGHPFVSFKDVFYNYFLPDDLSQLVRSTEKEQEKCSVRRGDVFLTRTSETMEDLGMSCVARKDYPGATFNGFSKRLRPSTDLPVHPEYVGYYLRTPQFRNEMLAFSTMSTRASLNNEMIGRLQITLPPLPEQKAIAHILGTLDDKIELNRRMNATLEGMAQALFKSWFVDFDPVIDNALAAGNPIPDELAPRADVRRQVLANGTTNREAAKPFPSAFQETESMGWIPEGWEVKSLETMIQLIGGGTPKTSVDDYWNGDIPWFSVVDAPSDSDVFVIDTDKKVTQMGVDNSSSKILREGTTIISARGTVGKCALVGTEMAMNQSCYGIQGTRGMADIYTYYTIREFVADLQQRGHGSVFNTITRDTFKSIRIPFGQLELTRSFDKTVSPFLQRIRANLSQQVELTKLRDTLLPKLISGELSISAGKQLTGAL
jgi:type I restriction enzyme, S subunit